MFTIFTIYRNGAYRFRKTYESFSFFFFRKKFVAPATERSYKRKELGKTNKRRSQY